MSKWSSAFRDSRWQQLRLKVMERDGWTCQSCRRHEGVTLNVHHVYYEAGKAPWEYDDDLLITYCDECHKKRHEMQKKLLVAVSWMDIGLLHSLFVVADCFRNSIRAIHRLSVAGFNDSSVSSVINKAGEK